MVDAEDALLLRKKQMAWSKWTTLFVWLFGLGFVGFVAVVAAALQDRIDPLIIAYYTGGWATLIFGWLFASVRRDRLAARAERAETRERFNAISRKYQERLAYVGRGDSPPK